MKTYKDIYKFPLVNHHGLVFDSKNQFVFQYLFYNEEKEQLLLDVINGNKTLKNPELKAIHKDGVISANTTNEPAIMIRGWGNLTGIRAHNLSSKEAANIQDTFAEYIVERLNFRD